MTENEFDRTARAWLEDGPTSMSDRALQAALDEVHATRQRRAWWPAWRFRDMNDALKLATAAVAVVVVALVGINLLPRSGGGGGPGPSPTSDPTLTASPTPRPSSSPTSEANVNFAGGDYISGTTYAIEDPCCVRSARMTFTIPAAGWYAPLESWRIGKNVAGGSDLFDLYVTPMFVRNIYTGGCDWRGTELSPIVGPSVDDLATALVAQAGPGASPPVSVTVGGHPGKKVELAIPEGLDTTTCDSDGDQAIFGWFVSERGYGAQPYTHGDGQHNTIYILDVDGTRQVIDAMYLPNTSAADRAEQDQIVASIRFELSPASPSPSP